MDSEREVGGCAQREEEGGDAPEGCGSHGCGERQHHVDVGLEGGHRSVRLWMSGT